jgi:hypothetical protein
MVVPISPAALASASSREFRVLCRPCQSRLNFNRFKARQRGLSYDASREPYAVSGDMPILMGRQIVTQNFRCLCGIRRNNIDMTPAGRSHITNRRGKCRKIMQRLTKALERQGLHVILHVSARVCSGPDLANTPSCEGAMLIGPRRVSKYSKPIRAFPSQEFASVLSVRAPSTR